MNPPIIDILRQQRNDAMDALANALAQVEALAKEIEQLKKDKKND